MKTRLTPQLFCWCAAALLGAMAIYGAYVLSRPPDVVVLNYVGEPYEQVRRQSRSTLPPDNGSNFLSFFVTRPAVFRFQDPQYGFVTPPAKFLFLGVVTDERVDMVTLSPQVKTLPLDESMAILIDLQSQLRRGGWKPLRVSDAPPIEDTVAMRASIRRCDSPTTYWQAGDKYQVRMNIGCFVRHSHPNEERYLITLDLIKPIYHDD